jgi:hypothetical protein
VLVVPVAVLERDRPALLFAVLLVVPVPVPVLVFLLVSFLSEVLWFLL